MNEDKVSIAKMDNIIIDNLNMLAKALQIATTSRFMSHEHGKTIWKSYLKVSGMDIPKDVTKPKKG